MSGTQLGRALLLTRYACGGREGVLCSAEAKACPARDLRPRSLGAMEATWTSTTS